MADHSSTRTAYVKEVVPGTTPATPAFKAFRSTQAGSLRTNKTTEESDEIRADGNMADVIQTGQGVSGSYPIEFSYGSFDDWLESVLCGAWATNVLKNGRALNVYTVEERRKAGVADAFSRFRGVIASQFDLAIAARQKITGSVGMMGMSEQLAAVIVTGATYAAASAEPVLNGASHIGTVTIPGLPAGGKIRSCNLTFTNDARERPYIGSLYSDELGIGQVKVKGEALVYFSDQAIYQAILDHTRGLFSLTAGAVTAKKYKIDIPQAVLGDGEIVAGGNTDDIMVRMPFSGVYDATSLASITVTRGVA